LESDELTARGWISRLAPLNSRLSPLAIQKEIVEIAG